MKRKKSKTWSYDRDNLNLRDTDAWQDIIILLMIFLIEILLFL